MADFSLDLNEDQLQIQKWVHDFAEKVIRPAAHEWDEREETPWPIIQEAAKIGLYSLDFIANAFGDPTGILLPVVMEEMCWGDAGITLAIFGTTLGVSGIFANGTPEQIGEWLPQCFGTPEKPALAAFGVSEPDAGSDVCSLRTRAVYDEAKDEWVLNGTKTWITNGGIADIHVVVAVGRPGSGRGARPASSSPRTPGLSPGPEVQEDGHPGLPHRRGRPRRRAGARRLPPRRQGEARRAPRPAPARARRVSESRRPWPPSRRPGRWSAPGGRHRPGRVRVRPRLRQGAQAVRSGHHREPGHRLQAGRHEDAHRRRPAPRVAGGVDGPQRQALRGRRGLAVQAVRR